MDRFRRRTSLLCTVATVLALHLTVIWLLLSTSRVIPLETKSQILDIVFLPHPASSSKGNPKNQNADNVTPERRSKVKPHSPPEVAPPSREKNAIQSPIDWSDELTRAARAILPDEPPQKSREFDFPHRAEAPADKPSPFGWDYAATHRVESIPTGGLLVHLDDNCVLVLFPFPLAGCAVSRKKANGHLFDHMRDAPEPGDDKQAK